MKDSLVIDPFKGDVKKIEMSRYIDLELYNRVERAHPFYKEMVEEICSRIPKSKNSGEYLKIMEIGAGTGLLTNELLKFDHLLIDAIELDEECCQLHKKIIKNNRCKCICDDAATFCRKNTYDVIVSSFAHDHIHYDLRYKFAANIKDNLKPGGIYIMGSEILPYYKTKEERERALYAYHCFIIEKALRDKSFEVAQIEINALKSGLEMTGDFKRHEEMFEEEMSSSNLLLVDKKKIGPCDLGNVGGVFVYVYRN